MCVCVCVCVCGLSVSTASSNVEHCRVVLTRDFVCIGIAERFELFRIIFSNSCILVAVVSEFKVKCNQPDTAQTY